MQRAGSHIGREVKWRVWLSKASSHYLAPLGWAPNFILIQSVEKSPRCFFWCEKVEQCSCFGVNQFRFLVAEFTIWQFLDTFCMVQEFCQQPQQINISHSSDILQTNGCHFGGLAVSPGASNRVDAGSVGWKHRWFNHGGLEIFRSRLHSLKLTFSPLKISLPNRKGLYSNHVSGRVGRRAMLFFLEISFAHRKTVE